MKYLDWVNLIIGVIGGVLVSGLVTELRLALGVPHELWIYR